MKIKIEARERWRKGLVGGFLLLLLAFILLLTGCGGGLETESLEHQKTFDEAIEESDIPKSDFYETYQSVDFAVSFYQSNGELGMAKFEKEEDGWHYRGGSSAKEEDARESAEQGGFGYFQTSSVKGTVDLSSEEKRVYVTVVYGSLFDDEISRVSVQMEEGNYEATISKGDGPRVWYVVLDHREKMDQPAKRVIGYRADGSIAAESDPRAAE
ncbi:hypothetical protein BEP19_08725 [Ammoniphilus oxalaticus]|uniref:Lipoprotein n=1 Tax=Ammoniphilus oxalaticus TaxID=66863 RepID=A0A419SK97_9BACL|nr:hypothetical protein [Ammoniphilus oxalaticus]RKD24461.1 hypothetical protein BEP19_08725 [Ammoniphilus oxalaticus]